MATMIYLKGVNNAEWDQSQMTLSLFKGTMQKAVIHLEDKGDHLIVSHMDKVETFSPKALVEIFSALAEEVGKTVKFMVEVNP